LGLAFKPDIDDLRESPALEIAKQLADTGAQLLVVEPNIEALPVKFNAPNATLMAAEAAVAAADVVVVLVKHSPFAVLVDTLRQHDALVDAVGLVR